MVRGCCRLFLSCALSFEGTIDFKASTFDFSVILNKLVQRTTLMLMIRTIVVQPGMAMCQQTFGVVHSNPNGFVLSGVKSYKIPSSTVLSLRHYLHCFPSGITQHQLLLPQSTSFARKHTLPRTRPLPLHKLSHTVSRPIGLPNPLFPTRESPSPSHPSLFASRSLVSWPLAISAMPKMWFDASFAMCH